MNINQLQDEIIEEFEGLDDWMDRYQVIIEMGQDMAPIPANYKTDEYKIDGCQSNVWLHAELDEEGVMHMQAESDALIVKGIVTMLLRVLNHQKPQDILSADLYFIDSIGLSEHLSPTRSNGLLAMLKQIKMYSLAFQNKC